MISSRLSLIATVAVAGLLSACAGSATRNSTSTAPTATPAAAPATAAPLPAPSTPGARVVPSRDGKYSGELIGTPVPGSKFAKLQIGMDMSEVQTILDRAPDRSHSYESGKRWIPFYFGNDARRMQAWFKGEGCLVFTNGNVWGGSGGDLIQIAYDPSGACYQP